MLSKFFKNRDRLQSADPAVRRAAVDALPDGEQETLRRIAADDTDSDVRRAAIARISDVDALTALLEEETAIADAAAKRIVALGAGAHSSHPRVVERALIGATDAASASALAARMVDRAAFARALRQMDQAEIRLALIEATEDEASLTEIEHAFRGHDKSVNRLARDRLAQIRGLKSDVAAARERAEALVERSRRDAQGAAADDPHRDAKRNALEREWSQLLATLEQANPALAAAGLVPTDLPALKARFVAPPPRPAATAQPAAADAAGTTDPTADVDDAANARADFDDLLREAAQLVARIRTDGDDVAALNEALAGLQEQWSALADRASPSSTEADTFHERCQNVRENLDALERARGARDAAAALLSQGADFEKPTDEAGFSRLWQLQAETRRTAASIDRLLESVAWPGDLTAPDWLNSLPAKAAQCRAFDERCHESFVALQDEIDAALAGLDAAIAAGELNQATQHRNRASNLVKHLPRSAQKGANAKVNGRSGALRELRDWQNFAERPKREGLCEEIEALAQQPLEPDEQMQRIKALRDQWNALGHASTAEDRALMARFNDAAEQAFATCRTYFAELAERRKFNLGQRTVICEQLESFVDGNDWERADYRAVDQILRTARDEWRKFHPVDRSPGRKLDTRFKKVTDRIYEHLKGEWDRNVAAKQAIVDEAQNALESDGPNAERIELMKQLQQRWKRIGPTPRRVDQRLWKAFREHCDAVFAERDAGRVERRAAIESVVNDADSILDELRSRLEGDDVLDRKIVADIERRLDDLGRLPREVERRARGLIDDARRVAAEHERQKQRERVSRWLTEVDALDASLAEIERGGGTVADWQERAGGAGADAMGLFDTRLASLGKIECDAEKLRKLAIEAEILADIDSPEPDRPLRLEIQVNRLNQGMNARDREPPTPEALVRRWCAEAALQTGAEALRDRFFTAVREGLSA